MMEITANALNFFYKMFLSCYMTGRDSSEFNRKKIEEILESGAGMSFPVFCSELKDWETRGRAIGDVAQALEKKVVDVEVLLNYFGGPSHTSVVAEELRESNFTEDNTFFRYAIFAHMLIPLKITGISLKKPLIKGVYENNGISVEVKHLVFLEKERKKILKGGIVLCHFPMVIDSAPSPEMIEILLSLQRKDTKFKRAAKSFPEGVDHAKFPYLMMLIKRML